MIMFIFIFIVQRFGIRCVPRLLGNSIKQDAQRSHPRFGTDGHLLSGVPLQVVPCAFVIAEIVIFRNNLSTLFLVSAIRIQL
jgi:hypothetical protein